MGKDARDLGTASSLRPISEVVESRSVAAQINGASFLAQHACLKQVESDSASIRVWVRVGISHNPRSGRVIVLEACNLVQLGGGFEVEESGAALEVEDYVSSALILDWNYKYYNLSEHSVGSTVSVPESESPGRLEGGGHFSFEPGFLLQIAAEVLTNGSSVLAIWMLR